MSPDLKIASITAILKNIVLGPDSLTNFRPISNLPFLAKVLECVIASLLQDLMQKNSLYEPLQSVFHMRHSADTTLGKIINYLLMPTDADAVTILVLMPQCTV